MKTIFVNPEIRFVMLDSSDLICTSGLEGVDVTENELPGARQRNSPIWDDYE